MGNFKRQVFIWMSAKYCLGLSFFLFFIDFIWSIISRLLRYILDTNVPKNRDHFSMLWVLVISRFTRCWRLALQLTWPNALPNALWFPPHFRFICICSGSQSVMVHIESTDSCQADLYKWLWYQEQSAQSITASATILHYWPAQMLWVCFEVILTYTQSVTLLTYKQGVTRETGNQG